MPRKVIGPRDIPVDREMGKVKVEPGEVVAAVGIKREPAAEEEEVPLTAVVAEQREQEVIPGGEQEEQQKEDVNVTRVKVEEIDIPLEVESTEQPLNLEETLSSERTEENEVVREELEVHENRCREAPPGEDEQEEVDKQLENAVEACGEVKVEVTITPGGDMDQVEDVSVAVVEKEVVVKLEYVNSNEEVDVEEVMEENGRSTPSPPAASAEETVDENEENDYTPMPHIVTVKSLSKSKSPEREAEVRCPSPEPKRRRVEETDDPPLVPLEETTASNDQQADCIVLSSDSEEEDEPVEVIQMEIPEPEPVASSLQSQQINSITQQVRNLQLNTLLIYIILIN